MDFHILTKNQAECLQQINTRVAVSSFFEPLRIVRELESLGLIEMYKCDDHDSGFCYGLTDAGKALTPFEEGTKYSIMYTPNGIDVQVQSRPEVATPAKMEALWRKNVELEAKVKDLQSAVDLQAKVILEQRKTMWPKTGD
jgi:hypothetical protein